LIAFSVEAATITSDDVHVLLFNSSQCSNGSAVAGSFLPIGPGWKWIAGFSGFVA
jgi:hypothetical protein